MHIVFHFTLAKTNGEYFPDHAIVLFSDSAFQGVLPFHQNKKNPIMTKIWNVYVVRNNTLIYCGFKQ